MAQYECINVECGKVFEYAPVLLGAVAVPECCPECGCANPIEALGELPAPLLLMSGEKAYGMFYTSLDALNAAVELETWEIWQAGRVVLRLAAAVL